jgi:hypothetical protein
MCRVSLAISVFLFLAGCRPAPMNYELKRRGPNVLLFPPVQTRAPVEPVVNVRISNARKHPVSRTECDFEGDLVSLHWHGNTAEVSLKPETDSTAPGNQGPTPVDRSSYVDPSLSVQAFRTSLLDTEAKGCLDWTEGRQLIRAMVEGLPLPPYLAYLLRFGSYNVTGRLDLDSDFRLQVIRPVYLGDTPGTNGNGGAPVAKKQFVGYQTAYYVFLNSKQDDRVKISLDSVTETDVGKTTPIRKSTTQSALPFPDSFGYFRSLFRHGLSASDHSATIVSATDPMKLEEATKQRESGPVDSCLGVSGPGVTCLTFTSEFAVNPQMRIGVNGTQKYVGVADTVGDAMNRNGPAAVIPKTLTVQRLFHGRLIPLKFDPNSRDILQLVLMPGDEITW